MSDRRIAILGGGGFAGRNVREVLERAGMEVAIFGRAQGCDLMDLQQSFAKLHDFRPSHIINCAAHVGSVNYVRDFAADVLDHNMRMVLNIYKIAQQMQGPLLINPIANCAYPGDMDLYEEGSLWSGPMHPSVLGYGAARRMVDVVANCYHSQYGVRSANLIVPNMYGPFDSTNPNKTHALNALVIKFVRAVREDLDQVEVWGTGKPIREWLYVKDFARVVRSVIEQDRQVLQPLNVAQNHGLTVDELVELITAKVNYKGAITKNAAYPDGAPKKVMSDARFRVQFPEFKFTALQDGLEETVEYYIRLF